MPISPHFPSLFWKLVYLLLFPVLATGTVLAQNHSLRFDGVDDFVKMNLAGSAVTVPNAEFTFETWFLTEETYDSPSTYSRPILRLNGNGILITVCESDGAYFLKIGTGTELELRLIVGATVETNVWRHLAVTYDGVAVRADIDCTY
ncbi:MAG: LamG-like jellyroll fold domain-containing protein, partial [Bacteroidota bacterium]